MNELTTGQVKPRDKPVRVVAISFLYILKETLGEYDSMFVFSITQPWPFSVKSDLHFKFHFSSFPYYFTYPTPHISPKELI